jgi:glycosyltransferase involved in cell wall biosynthesis
MIHKIAYFSPLSPERSGVSDFSEELIYELKKYINIALFTARPIKNKRIDNDFVNYRIKDFADNRISENCDLYIYHAGNNLRFHKEIIDTFKSHIGILEMHDFSMHHYLAADTYAMKDFTGYIGVMGYCHGTQGQNVAKQFLSGKIQAPWDNPMFNMKFTVNKHLIDLAQAVIVHSDMAKQMVKAIAPDKNVICIQLHTDIIVENFEDYKVKSKKKIGIHENTLLFGSFGYATISKRIIPTLEALSKFKESNPDIDFMYSIVGEVQVKGIRSILRKLKLTDHVKITGFVGLEEFKNYMGACDICINLRFPTQGESSATLHRMLGRGKPVLVTDIGTYEEYPDDTVFKVSYGENEVNDIFTFISRLSLDKKLLHEIGIKTITYAKKYCDLQKNAKKYLEFFDAVKNGTFVDNALDIFIDKLIAKGNITDADIKKILSDMPIQIIDQLAGCEKL